MYKLLLLFLYSNNIFTGGNAEIADCIHLGFCTMWEIQKNTCPYATTVYVYVYIYQGNQKSSKENQ